MAAGGPIPLIPVVLAALAGAAASWWAYARLEEPVPGRAGPAILRGIALFLLLAGWWLPSVSVGAGGDRPTTALLVDRSLSMSLPASVGGMSRADSAALLAADVDRATTLWFGDSARLANEGDGAGPEDAASRVVPALEAARAGGADQVVLLT
ncbi:MAG: hypothetical protein ACODAB_10710, partial [Gemmatimonadota bacterium]